MDDVVDGKVNVRDAIKPSKDKSPEVNRALYNLNVRLSELEDATGLDVRGSRAEKNVEGKGNNERRVDR